ncbi:GGDEF domain-containing protein [Dyella psychrodurans]|uniref:diguanylate cyclase n=1 Tax=Dyella psychrodurans TaxID=1927960 RepID=A0A370WVR0_9GAMM|nr:GGDEF domain-containing protein [Dyella psychrodurans]RDS80045.1 GGDEF domain-containing protein [Dyella psychrodurans]
MQLNVETLALINGGQAVALALMLWFGAHDGSRYALNGLRLRAGALVVEACGDFLLASDVHVSPLVVLLFGNGFNLVAQALTIVALRMVLRRSLLWRTSLTLCAVGWLGAAWLSVIHPNYPERVLWGSVILVCNNALNIAALWGGCGKRETRAQCVLLWAYVLAIALLVWRNVSMWMLPTPLQSISAPSSINSLYVLLIGIQPLLASVGFLLLYNEILQRELFKLARIDPLTGVNNRLGLLEASETLLARARAKHESIGVLLIDADHFKSINDRFGHDDGDRVLLELVANIRSMLRAGDMVGRVGGEEFLVFSPAVQTSDLLALAERIRVAIERTSFSIAGESYALTVSIGAAIAHGNEPDMMGARRRADMALYDAKRAGRNCVRIAAS